MLTICLTLAGTLSPALGFAQSSRDVGYQEALDTVLEDVADPAKSFQFVKAATEAGDLRGAAAALERMLLLDPRLANIRLELGIIYLQLGNPELGRYHILEALRAPNVPSAVRVRAERYLSAASASDTPQRHLFSGRLSFGRRADDNANSGTDALEVLVPFDGNLVVVPLDGASGESDSSSELLSTFSHSYAFANLPGSFWDSNIFAFANRYDDLNDLDFMTLRLDTGPLFSFGGQTDAPWQVRPSVSVAKAWLDSEDYIDSQGVGVELRKIYASRAITSLRVRELDQDYLDQPGRFLSDRTGDYRTAELMQVWQLRRTQLTASLLNENAEAEAAHRSFDRVGASLGFRRYFGQNGARPPWSISTTLLWRESDYEGLDPMLYPDRIRLDTRFDVRFSIEVPVSRRLALTLSSFYTDNESNVPVYEFDNTGVAAGLSVRL